MAASGSRHQPRTQANLSHKSLEAAASNLSLRANSPSGGATSCLLVCPQDTGTLDSEEGDFFPASRRKASGLPESCLSRKGTAGRTPWNCCRMWSDDPDKRCEMRCSGPKRKLLTARKPEGGQRRTVWPAEDSAAPAVPRPAGSPCEPRSLLRTGSGQKRGSRPVLASWMQTTPLRVTGAGKVETNLTGKG